MKELYKIFNYQKEVLIQQKMRNGNKYNPIQDINGDWFISEEEHKNCGLGTKTEFAPPEEGEFII